MPLLSTERVFTGCIVTLQLDRVRYPDGSEGTLEMLRHPGASAVLPFLDPPDAADPRVILIRQFRHAADGELWEIPAGRLDPGETAEACARRELEEEAGVRADRVEALTSILTTPGFTDERIHLFLAHGLHEVPHRREADEFMEVHRLRWSEVLAMAGRGDITDGKTLSAVLFARCFRHVGR